jgi:hypothetical protein
MLNGTGMPSDKVSILNSCIIPRPGNPDQYFVFVNECVNNSCGGKLKYSLVDITLDGGNGAVVPGQKNIPVFHHAINNIAFTKHSNNINFWLAYSEKESPYNICIIPININGPDTTNRIISAFNGPLGFGKFSPDNTVFATTSYEAFQFNASSGTLSNKINFPTDSLTNYTPFSLEFSPNSKMLYFPLIQGGGYRNVIQQFNLSVFTQTAVSASVYSFFDSSVPLCFCGIGHAQLAVNGKIYIARAGGFIDTLHVIHNPNAAGAACNFQYNAIGLNSRACNFSLPIFPDYYFNNIPLLTNINDLALLNSNLLLYPNPCSEKLNLTHKITANYTYTILNQLGQTVHTSTNNQQLGKINISSLPNGLYYLTVQSSIGTSTKKIIINH